MERFPPAKLVKAGNKIIVLIHLKTNADLINVFADNQIDYNGDKNTSLLLHK